LPALVLTATLGCGGGVLPASVHPVKGKVVLGDGKPLTSGRIHFAPQRQPGRPAAGTISRDGTFTLTTVTEGDGAETGDYRVYIDLGEGVPPKVARAIAKYCDFDSTDLVVSVQSGSTELPPLVLK
jgi:hypothetical protein